MFLALDILYNGIQTHLRFPVEEQNKIQSEVALSLLGIPRSEVALGIFADVNTYDVDPAEWTQTPLEKKELTDVSNPYEYFTIDDTSSAASSNKFGHGLSHVPEEAGALLEAPPNKTAVLTSKRFFRYQPGRVSAATFGVKTSITPGSLTSSSSQSNRNPAIRKYGIYDNFDGYYWESRDTGKGDQFCVVRRTQALIKHRSGFGTVNDTTFTQKEDYGIVGQPKTDSVDIDFATASANGTTLTYKISHQTASPYSTPVAGMTLIDRDANKGFSDGSTERLKGNTIISSVSINGDDVTLELSTPVKNQFQSSYPSTNAGKFTADFAGDLVIVRDGLVMTHAAMYDPSLLKDDSGTTHEISAIVDTDTLTLSDVTGLKVGQMVRYDCLDSTDSSGELANSLLTCSPNSQAKSLLIISDITGSNVTFTKFTDNTSPSFASVTITAGKHFIKTPVPFIFPSYLRNTLANDNLDTDIMFPYSRNKGSDNVEFTTAPTVVGAIDTTGISAAAPTTFRDQINAVNNGLRCRSLNPTDDSEDTADTRAWSNWIRDNVKPEYYGVYEYRVPRSRFSFDFLDGSANKNFEYSDVVKLSTAGTDTIKYPGQAVPKDDGTSGGKTLAQSQWNIDFEKVIMNKIEFSWYGAVGALFLAYVPVNNDEARWVRVHHIRASNQLKVASLGNATLPITYTVYGGGTEMTAGRAITNRESYAGGKSSSEFVIKYGSSYYIDGGDRGTVKLFNYADADTQQIVSSTYTDTSSDNTLDKFTITLVSNNSSAGQGEIIITQESSPSDIDDLCDDILMGAKVVTDNANDTDLKVEYIERIFGDQSPNTHSAKVILNKEFADASTTNSNKTDIEFKTDSAPVLYGLTSKTEIESSQDFKVRNRVQVYPTKLSVGMTTQNQPTRIELIKNAIYQTDEVFDLAAAADKRLTISGGAVELASGGLPTKLCIGSATSANNNLSSAFGTTFEINKELYGWFRAKDEQGVKRTLFGFVRRVTPELGGTFEYEFHSLDVFTDKLFFDNDVTFLYAKQYMANGSVATVAETATATHEIERLSSIHINKTTRRPIPGTGTRIASFFLENGSEYFDLSPYFDYNKDYISFPLTDIPDNLFLSVKADKVEHASNSQIAASITWEEQ